MLLRGNLSVRVCELDELACVCNDLGGLKSTKKPTNIPTAINTSSLKAYSGLLPKKCKLYQINECRRLSHRLLHKATKSILHKVNTLRSQHSVPTMTPTGNPTSRPVALTTRGISPWPGKPPHPQSAAAVPSQLSSLEARECSSEQSTETSEHGRTQPSRCIADPAWKPATTLCAS